MACTAMPESPLASSAARSAAGDAKIGCTPAELARPLSAAAICAQSGARGGSEIARRLLGDCSEEAREGDEWRAGPGRARQGQAGPGRARQGQAEARGLGRGGSNPGPGGARGGAARAAQVGACVPRSWRRASSRDLPCHMPARGAAHREGTRLVRGADRHGDANAGRGDRHGDGRERYSGGGGDGLRDAGALGGVVVGHVSARDETRCDAVSGRRDRRCGAAPRDAKHDSA